MVLDKANGGKADALNAGLNAARYPLVCCVDADGLLEPDAVRQMACLFARRENTVAVGGMVRPMNGCTARAGRINRIQLPRKPLELVQVVDYLRAFRPSRFGWDSINSLLIVSGAFGMFDRATLERGRSANTGDRFGLSDDTALELMQLFFTPDEQLYNKTIDDVLGEEFFQSNFWLYWQTMFAFETWHSALEMKRYLQRFLHHIGGLPDLSALKFTKYNQYESLIQPLVAYLQENGVQFEYGVRVVNVLFNFLPGKKVAHQLVMLRHGREETLDLTQNDLVFVTNGSCTEASVLGDNDHAPELDMESGQGSSWELWKNIAVQNPVFGRPEVFCSNIEATKWESATITLLDDRIAPYVQQVCGRDPYAGKVVTGGIVTVKDSAWLMSWTFNRQPHFKAQPEGQLVGWIYGLYPERPGDYVGKPMEECTGAEICMEWLYHLGVPENEIETLARESASTVPCMMPYITAFFMPRKAGDRPAIVPEGCVNFAFLGQFTETPRDTVFTVEYSVRTAMEAVYTLLGVERGVPEVFGSVYDVRCLLNAAHCLLDGRKLTDMKLPLPYKLALHAGLEKVQGTTLEELLADYQLN